MYSPCFRPSGVALTPDRWPFGVCDVAGNCDRKRPDVEGDGKLGLVRHQEEGGRREDFDHGDAHAARELDEVLHTQGCMSGRERLEHVASPASMTDAIGWGATLLVGVKASSVGRCRGGVRRLYAARAKSRAAGTGPGRGAVLVFDEDGGENNNGASAVYIIHINRLPNIYTYWSVY